jgi:predicted NAD/FAD-dependent oxidoreductase
VATNATHASALLEDAGLTTELNTATNSVTTWYHAVATTSLPEPLARRRSVITVPDKRSGPVINTVPLTYAVPSYSPDGQILISSSTLGVDDSAEVGQAVRGHLEFLYGADTSGWELVARYPIHGALPSMRGPLTVAGSGEHGPVILAGDYCATASIQGAMISGRHAADAACRRLGVVRPDDRRIAV